jgi:hypothetical protein
MEQGDMAGAGKALIMSYDQIPDGRTVQGGVDQSGNGTINIVDTRTGKAVQQMQVTPQLLKMAAMKLSDGSEFYSHLSRMAPQKSAAPQRQAALPAYYTGGPVEDQDVDPAMYGEDAADAEVARDASLSATSEDSPEEDLPAVGAVETSGTGSPGGAVPTPPEYVDTTGMNTRQLARATAKNRQLAQVYTQDMQNYRQGEVTARQNQARTELEQFRQRAEGRRAASTSAAADRRAADASAAADKRIAATSAAASALSDRQDRQTIARDQRVRFNGKTIDDMRTDLAEADLKGKVLQYRVGETDPTPREYALPAGVTGGSGQYSNPEETLTMPEGLNEPQTLGEQVAAVGSQFDREFAASPGQQLRMTNARAASQEERELTAAESAANAKRVNRGDFAELDAYIDNKETGLFTRPDPKDPKKRVYFGAELPAMERTAIRNWSRKLASFNEDMAPETAGQAVQSLLSVKTKGDVDPVKFKGDLTPVEDRNYTISVDPKTGMGRLSHKNGLVAFNLDRESIRQIGLLRQSYIAKKWEDKYKADGDKDLAAKAAAERARIDELLKKQNGKVPATEEQRGAVLGSEATVTGRRIQENFSPEAGIPMGGRYGEGFRPIRPGYDLDPSNKPF